MWLLPWSQIPAEKKACYELSRGVYNHPALIISTPFTKTGLVNGEVEILIVRLCCPEILFAVDADLS